MRRLTPSIRILIAGSAVLGLLTAAMVSVPLLMVMGSNAVSTATGSSVDSQAVCGPSGTVGGQTITLDAAAVSNAQTVISTGQALGVPDRGLVVAIAAALQESKLQNLSGGDRDSVGLFQQRNAWGSASDRTDPAVAAKMFYTGGHGGQPGLLDIAGWAQKSVNDAAQAVQNSGFPFAYGQWTAMASSLVSKVVGGDPLKCTDVVVSHLPTGATGTMIQAALSKQGSWYEWGATGPDTFDCSGLVVWSWGQAGYLVRVRTADQMYHNSTPVAFGQEQPGDLLFSLTRGGFAHHVMIVVSKGQAVEAPHTGAVVRTTSYGKGVVIGRLNSSVLTKIGTPA